MKQSVVSMRRIGVMREELLELLERSCDFPSAASIFHLLHWFHSLCAISSVWTQIRQVFATWWPSTVGGCLWLLFTCNFATRSWRRGSTFLFPGFCCGTLLVVRAFCCWSFLVPRFLLLLDCDRRTVRAKSRWWLAWPFYVGGCGWTCGSWKWWLVNHKIWWFCKFKSPLPYR